MRLRQKPKIKYAETYNLNKLSVVLTFLVVILIFEVDSAKAEWVDLGGDLKPGNIECTSWGHGRIDCFGIGNDGNIHHIWYDRSWGSWENLGGNEFEIAGRPDCLSWGHGRLDCFIRGRGGSNGQGSVYHLWYRGSGFRWENMGGDITGSIDCVTTERERLDCFGVGNNDQLQQLSYSEEGWSSWIDIPSGRRLTNPPEVPRTGLAPECEALGGGRIYCAVRNYYGELISIRYDGRRWGRWERPRSATVSHPECTSWGDDRLDCFSIDPAGRRLRHHWVEGTRWRMETFERLFEDEPVFMGSRPECVSWAEGRLDCFAMSEDRNLAHIWFDNGWGFEVISASFSRAAFANLDCVSWGFGRIDCFKVGDNNQLLQKWYQGAGWQPQ